MTRRAEEAEQNAATATAQLANAIAHQSAIEVLIAHPKLQNATLKHEQYGPSAERSRRLLAQMDLQLEELEAAAAEDDLIAEEAAAKTSMVTWASSRFNWPMSASLPKSPDTCLASCRFHRYKEC
jgi:transposase